MVGLRTGKAKLRLFLYAVREFFDDGVGKDFAGDAFYLGAGGVGGQAFCEGNREILALAHAGNICKADFAQRVLDGLALGVQHRWLQRDIDMRLHNP